MPNRFKTLDDYICSLTDERAGALYKTWVSWRKGEADLPRELRQFAELSETRSRAARCRKKQK